MAADAGRARLAALAVRFDALSTRERAMAFAVLLALAWGTWDFLLFGPLDARRAALEERVPRIEADIAALNDSAALLTAAREQDPDAGPRAQLASLRRERERLQGELKELTARVVSPRHMAGVLERVLTRETGLELLRLEGLGVEPVSPAPDTSRPPGPPVTIGGVARCGRAAAAGGPPATASAGIATPAGPSLYRHGLRVEFEGGYLQTLSYLQALEALDTGFQWSALEFEVLEYPRAGIAITVHSLSLDDAWIGI